MPQAPGRCAGADSTALAARYQTLIQDELGLVAHIDEDQDVVFRHPDLGSLYIRLDADHDPEYLMLVYPSFANQESTGLDRVSALNLVNEANRCCKAAKVYLVPQADDPQGYRLSATIECFLAASDQAPEPALLKAVLARNLKAIQHLVQFLAKACQAHQAAPALRH